jgi:hypothetical protein
VSESVQRMLNSDGKSARSSFVGLVSSDRERKSRPPEPKKASGSNDISTRETLAVLHRWKD